MTDTGKSKLKPIPLKLRRAADHLSKQGLELPTGGGDSRQDSATAEDRVVSMLQNNPLSRTSIIHSPNIGGKTNRAWYDVRIENYYCNIKVSSLHSADNVNAKNAIYYFLTGKPPESFATEELFFKAMSEREKCDESRDYYYLIVNKNDTTDIFFANLKGLAAIVPNPSNPPFQCKWNQCRDPVDRSWNEARKFLLDAWADTIKRKIRIAQAGMPAYYPDFFHAG